MKKLLNIFAATVLFAVFFGGCSNSIDSTIDLNSKVNSRAVVPLESRISNVNIHFINANNNVIVWNIWAWNSLGNYDNKAWPGGSYHPKKNLVYENVYTYKNFSVNPLYDLGLLFCCDDEEGSRKTIDYTIPKEKLINGTDIYIVSGEPEPYYDIADCVGFKSMTLFYNYITGSLFGASVDGFTKEEANNIGNYTVKDSLNVDVPISSVSLQDNVLSEIDFKIVFSAAGSPPYKLTFNSPSISKSYTKEVYPYNGAIDNFDSILYAGNDLGVTIASGKATFKLWAPTASDVKLLVYDNISKIGNFKPETVEAKAIGATDEATLKGEPACEKQMTRAANGLWVYTGTDILTSTYKYYKYQITVDGKILYVCDINAKVCAPDSVASQIIDVNDSACKPAGWTDSYKNPFGTNGTITKKYSDSVIYEMHIRDWSYNSNNSTTGKFTEIAEDTEFINHLKDLGVTHVQIVPVFDYAQVKADKSYNWGYNPYHYNVPETRYVDDEAIEGNIAVKEMRQMVKAFHDNGIAVIMDVVYNHTSGINTGSLYDSTVPGYFYFVDLYGNYTNYSGCGNALNLDRKMVRKYVIDSLKHWMQDYHINGFRFDLMGIHSKSAMMEIYDELYTIDKNVMVYGEPWTGNGEDPYANYSSGTIGAIGAIKVGGRNGIGAFDDDYRDAIKGSEFGGFNVGHVQGKYDGRIELGLKGEEIGGTDWGNHRNSTGDRQLAIHYVECHDNFTLFDKLSMSYLGLKNTGGYFDTMLRNKGIADVKKMDKLAAAYIILSQGTPFINGGQEFCRTKNGNDNSYNANDGVNNISLSRKLKYIDVFQNYRGLIALRKDYEAFRNPSSVASVKLADGITKYTVNHESGNFTVFFNASGSDYTLSDAVSGKVVDVASAGSVTGSFYGFGVNDVGLGTLEKYSIASTTSDTKKINAKSFVIIKTN